MSATTLTRARVAAPQAAPKRPRDPWFDNAKMLLVLLVVVGHSWTLVADTTINDRLYDWLYLWHIPAIAVATFAMAAVGLDAYDVDALYFWALLALRAVVFAVVMAVAFWLLSPLEHRRLPWWDATNSATGVRSTLGGALVCVAGVALVLMAKNGLTGVDGWGTLGCFLTAAAAARVSIGSWGTQDSSRARTAASR